jgi:hypothetical protein
MRAQTALAILLLLTSAVPSAARAAEELVVVVNARNPSKRLTRAELRAMLTGNRSFWHGVVPVKAVVRSPKSAAGQRLFAGVLAMEPGQFSAHWTARQLAGQGVAPEAVATAADVAARVAAAPGGVGVVTRDEAGALPATVKVIPLE